MAKAAAQSSAETPTERALTAIKSRLITHTQSMKLVKNLFRVAFSSIGYVRHFFHDSCYKNKRVGEQVYKVIRKGIDSNATRYINWLEKGVFEALNHGYLSDVLLEIYHPTTRSTSNSCSTSSAENTKKLCEMYAFSVVYGNSKVQLSLADTKESKFTKENASQFQKKHIFKSSKQMLNAILRMTQSLAPLPTKHIISIRLLYTRNTPPLYEPPLFRPATDTFGLDWFECTHVPSFRAGQVVTPYHDMKVELFTSDHCLNGNNPDSHIAMPATNSTATRSHAVSTDSAINRTLFESEMYTFSDDSASDLKQQGEQQSLKKQRDLQKDQAKPTLLGQVNRDFDDGSSASTAFDDGLSDIAPLSLSFSDRLSMARSKHTQEKKKLGQMGTVSQKKRSWDSDRDIIANNGNGMNQNGADKGKSDSIAQGKQKRRKNSISKDPVVENESF